MSETLRGSQEQNILTMMVWNAEHAPTLAAVVPPSLMADHMYQRIAEVAIDYVKQYKCPPREHIKDLLEREVRRPDANGKMYMQVLDDMQRLAPTLQADYVIAELDKFIRIRRRSMRLQDAILALEAGDETKANPLINQVALDTDKSADDLLPDPWAEPEPPPFDPDILPPVLRSFVKDRAQTTGFDPAGYAWAALSSCSMALDGSVLLQMKRYDDGWTQPPGIWCLLLGDSGTGRSGILKDCWRPLKAIQEEWRQRHRQELARWKATAKDDRGDEPHALRLITTEANIEGFRDIMARQARGIGCCCDEWAGFIGMLDAYSQGKGSGIHNRTFFLESFDGGSRDFDRSEGGRGNIHVLNNHVVVCGGIQPDRLRELGNLKSDGLIQRDVVMILRGKRGGEDRPSSGRAVNDYDFLIRRLSMQSGGRTVTMSAEALAVREDVERQVAPYTENNIIGDGFKTFCGKLMSMWGRLTLVLGHIIQTTSQNEPPTEIRFQAADIARRLILDHVLLHAMQFYTWLGGASGNVELTRQIASLLVRDEIARITTSTLTHNITECRGMRLDEVQRAVSPLVAMGLLTPERDYNPRAWLVNPAIYKQFAARAAHERIVVAQKRELMQRSFAQRRAEQAVAEPHGDKCDCVRVGENTPERAPHDETSHMAVDYIEKGGPPNFILAYAIAFITVRFRNVSSTHESSSETASYSKTTIAHATCESAAPQTD